MTATESAIQLNNIPPNRFFPYDHRNVRGISGHNAIPRILRGIYDSSTNSIVRQNPGTTLELFSLDSQLVFIDPPSPASSGITRTASNRDNTFPPIQKFVGDEVNQRVKREISGNITYMSMMVPWISLAERVSDNPPVRLYTIVFNKRDLTGLDPAIPPVSGNDAYNPPENIMEVDTSRGVHSLPVDGTGEIVLGGIWDRNLGDNEENAALRTKELSIKQNDWIMLSQTVTRPNLPPFQRFLWYRVSSVDIVLVSPGLVSSNPDRVVTRTISVQGPNWEPINGTKVYATIVRDVVGVYETTIQPSRSSLWNPDLF